MSYMKEVHKKLEEVRLEKEETLNKYQQRVQAVLAKEHERRKALFGPPAA